MNKCKIVTKSGITQLIVKSQKGQQVNDREVFSINNNEVPGLLHLDVIRKGSGFRMVFNLTGFIPFKKFLINPLNKESFGRILQNIVDVMKAIQNAYFSQEQLLMDFDYVMVNPTTQTIYFTYLPIQGMTEQTTFRDFLLGIIQFASFSQAEDNAYVRDYIAILNNGVNFSLFDLEQYIERLTGKHHDSDASRRECPKCHTTVKKTTVYCPACGVKLTGLTGTTHYNVYDPLAESVPAMAGGAPPEQRDEPEPMIVSVHSATAYEPPAGGTSVLGAEHPVGATTVLTAEQLGELPTAYLIRLSNQQKIMVNKSEFRIGHDVPDLAYVIDDNGAVSRRHAVILQRDGRFYMKDLRSTNGTYLDDKRIDPEVEVELYSGTRVKLADEKFEFYIE